MYHRLSHTPHDSVGCLHAKVGSVIYKGYAGGAQYAQAQRQHDAHDHYHEGVETSELVLPQGEECHDRREQIEEDG